MKCPVMMMEGKWKQRTDSKSSQIKAIEQLVAKDIIKKEDVADMINKTNLKQPSPLPLPPKARSRLVRIDLAEESVFTTLKAKTFCRSASPETVKVRECIAEPIESRFRHEVSRKDSQLFTAVRPRRLREQMFESSVRDPLKEIYTRHTEELKDVFGGKILKIIKWKIRKMRVNPLRAKACISRSSFDFDSLAKKLERRQLNNSSFLKRRSSFHNTKTTPDKTSGSNTASPKKTSGRNTASPDKTSSNNRTPTTQQQQKKDRYLTTQLIS